MNREAFTDMLTKEGFPDTVLVTREPNGAMEVPTHPFEAKALIVEGEMHIRVGEDEHLYRVGNVFHLPANAAHTERYGPQGVKFLVGRK